MLLSVVRAIARRAGRSTVRRETNSATRCCESAAEPPLPQTISLRPACMASAVSLPACKTASWMDSSLSTAVIVATDWLSCFLTRSLMMNSRVSARLTRGGREEAGWRIRFGERGRIFEVDAIEFHGVRAFLDLSVNGSDVLPHHTEKKELKRGDEKYSDQHGRKAKAEGRPEDQLKDEVDQGDKKRETRPKEAGEGGETKRDLGVVNDAEHAEIIEGVPVVLGNSELAGRLIVEERYGGKANVGDHAAEVGVGVIEGPDEFDNLPIVKTEAGKVL